MQITTLSARHALCTALLALAPVALPAQSTRENNALDAAVRGYQLTMPKVDAWARASIEATRALKSRTTPPPEPEREAKTIDEMAAQFDAIPEMRRAIRKAGMSTKEYALLGMVMMQAQMYQAVQAENPRAEVPYNMNPANVAFMKANKAAVEKRVKEVAAASGQ